MQTIVIALALLFPTLADAKAATSVAADQKEDIRVLGKLNVNSATREQLLTVPGLDPQVVEAIVSARQKAPIDDLSTLPIAPAATQHLKTGGSSDYRRIRVLPLQVMAAPATTATR
jgi:DNA uptake protein ComE-like DNA-binding protein